MKTLHRRRTRPTPPPVDPAAVAANLRACAHHLETGHPEALALLTGRSEWPISADQWADYPMWADQPAA